MWEKIKSYNLSRVVKIINIPIEKLSYMVTENIVIFAWTTVLASAKLPPV